MKDMFRPQPLTSLLKKAEKLQQFINKVHGKYSNQTESFDFKLSYLEQKILKVCKQFSHNLHKILQNFLEILTKHDPKLLSNKHHHKLLNLKPVFRV